MFFFLGPEAIEPPTPPEDPYPDAEKIDVSGFDYWLTLGGTAKGSTPSQAEIEASLLNAQKMETVISLTGSAEGKEYAGSENPPIVSKTVNLGYQEQNWWRATSEGMTTGTETGTNSGLGQQIETVYQYESDSLACEARLMLKKPVIVKMYNGPTEDQENFVGYGLKSYDNDWANAITDFDSIPPIEYGAFEACGRAIKSGGEVDIAKECYVSYVPDVEYFPVIYPEDQSLSITATTFGGVPLFKISYLSNQINQIVSASLSGITFA